MAVIYTYPLKSTPANNDLILISDSADKNKTKQVSIESINSLGVSKIVAGNNITISSTGANGTGDITINSTGGGGGGQLPIENGGTQITSAASKINFTGAGITASSSGNDVTVDVPLTTVNTTTEPTDYNIAFIKVDDLNNVRVDDKHNFIYHADSAGNNLQVISDAKAKIKLKSFTTNNFNNPTIEFLRHRGTKASPSNVLINNKLGTIEFRGNVSSAASQLTNNNAHIFARATQDYTDSTNTNGAELVFGTKKNGSSGDPSPTFPSDSMILGNDGNLKVQQVYSNNSIGFINLESNSSSTLEFDGNTHLPTIKLSYKDAAAPSSLTINFVNVYATIPYFIYIHNTFTGKTITFNYNGSANKIFFPSGTNLPLTVPSGHTLLQFNFLDPPAPGQFNVPSGFGTVIGTGYSS